MSVFLPLSASLMLCNEYYKYQHFPDKLHCPVASLSSCPLFPSPSTSSQAASHLSHWSHYQLLPNRKIGFRAWLRKQVPLYCCGVIRLLDSLPQTREEICIYSWAYSIYATHFYPTPPIERLSYSHPDILCQPTVLVPPHFVYPVTYWMWNGLLRF